MSPVQIKLAIYGGAALLLWLLARESMRAGVANISDPGRVKKTLDVDANVDSPTFGLTDAQIAAMNSNNPAVDPEMRRLIDASNAALAADERENGNVNGVGP